MAAPEASAAGDRGLSRFGRSGDPNAERPRREPVEELDAPPSLPALYARSLAGALLPGRPDELPERTLALREQEIDVERLADYCEVCGFRLAPELPLTYPHLLGFPLELELMSARSFPFAVMGVVHIANRIERLRPIPVEARVDVLVRAEGLRPHRRGRQFDLVTELELDGEPVWREHSTYLSSGGGSEGGDGDGSGGEPGGGKHPGAGGPPGAGDEPAGEVAAEWKVPGDIGRRYGDVSGDRNPIHMHALAAKPFGFPGAIAHGMWMKARCVAALEGRLPDAVAAEVGFRRPLRIPGRARLRVGARDRGYDLALEPPGEGRPHLTGRVAPAA